MKEAEVWYSNWILSNHGLAKSQSCLMAYEAGQQSKDAEIARLKTELAQMSEWHDHAGNRAEKAEARIAELNIYEAKCRALQIDLDTEKSGK